MKTKFYFVCFLSLLFSTANIRAQAPAWSWAKSGGGTANDGSTGVAADASGNVYMTGTFSSPTIDFGTGTMTNAGIVNFYIVKYDVNGNVLWTRSGGGNYLDYSWGLATDPAQNLLVCGSFQSDTIDLGTGALVNDSANFRDIFLGKYDSLGNTLWSKRFGGKKDDLASSIATDTAGNMYVAGYFKSDSLSIDAITVQLLSPSTSFLAKFDPNGNALWVRTAGGYSGATHLALDGAGNVTYAGNFLYLNLVIGTDTLTNTDGWGNITDDIYVARYTSSGNFLWAKNFGGTDQDYLTGLAADPAGNSFVTGYFFSDSIQFDGFTKVNHSGGGSDDYYFARYDANGNALWVQGIPERYAEGYAVRADAFGGVYVAGNFSDTTATFGNTVLHQDTSAAAFSALFLTKYTTSGNAVWAKSISMTDYSGIWALTTNAGGDLFMIGDFSSNTLQLDSLTLTNTTTGSQIFDAFISKIGTPCHAYYTVQPDTAPHTWIAIDYATGAAPLTYSWNWGDGNTSPGATPSHTYATAGNYNICQTITDANNCADTYCDSSVYLNRPASGSSTVTIFVVGSIPSGLVDPGATGVALVVYPNPSNSKVTISGGEINSTYSVTDMTGKLLLSGKLMAPFEVLDLGKFARGIYFLTVTGKNEQIVRKIIRD